MLLYKLKEDLLHQSQLNGENLKGLEILISEKTDRLDIIYCNLNDYIEEICQMEQENL